jgi:transposase
MLRDGVRPQIRLIADVPANDLSHYERLFVRSFKAFGSRLTNGTEGGEEQFVPTDEVRSKLSDAMKAKSGEIVERSKRLWAERRDEMRAAVSAGRRRGRAEVDAKIVAVAESGRYSTGDIAKLVGVDSGTVRRVLRDAGKLGLLISTSELRRRMHAKKNKPTHDAIIKMLVENVGQYTTQSLADMIGVDRTTVRGVVLRHGLESALMPPGEALRRSKERARHAKQLSAGCDVLVTEGRDSSAVTTHASAEGAKETDR